MNFESIRFILSIITILIGIPSLYYIFSQYNSKSRRK